MTLTGLYFLCVSADTAAVELPRLLWSTPTVDVMFVGQNKSIKCIFSGL